MKENKNLTAGIVLINKPRGISSNTVVNIVKRATNAKKAGHLGTLDLAGEGLLPVVLNKATILFDYFLSKDKTYNTVFEFGKETDTLDLEGQVTAQKECDISEKDVLSVIPDMLGKQQQMPPIYSAKRVNGKRAYDLARSGQAVELKPKEIEIFSIRLLKKLEKNVFEFEIHCSSGTYIRSIARDMAQKLSTYGIMQRILRTRCGNFDLTDAFSLEQIKSGQFEITPIDTLFDFPKILLSTCQKDSILNGQNISLKGKNGLPLDGGLYRAYHENNFLGVIEVKGETTKFKFRFV